MAFLYQKVILLESKQSFWHLKKQKQKQMLCQRWRTKSNHKEPLEKTLNEGHLPDKWLVIFRNVSEGLRKCCRMKEIEEMQLNTRLSQDYDSHHFDVEESETKIGEASTAQRSLSGSNPV